MFQNKMCLMRVSLTHYYVVVGFQCSYSTHDKDLNENNLSRPAAKLKSTWGFIIIIIRYSYIITVLLFEVLL